MNLNGFRMAVDIVRCQWAMNYFILALSYVVHLNSHTVCDITFYSNFVQNKYIPWSFYFLEIATQKVPKAWDDMVLFRIQLFVEDDFNLIGTQPWNFQMRSNVNSSSYQPLLSFNFNSNCENIQKSMCQYCLPNRRGLTDNALFLFICADQIECPKSCLWETTNTTLATPRLNPVLN